MPRTPEEEQELQELKALAMQLPDDEPGTTPPKQDGFFTDVGQGGYNMVTGLGHMIAHPIDTAKGFYNLPPEQKGAMVVRGGAGLAGAAIFGLPGAMAGDFLADQALQLSGATPDTPIGEDIGGELAGGVLGKGAQTALGATKYLNKKIGGNYLQSYEAAQREGITANIQDVNSGRADKYTQRVKDLIPYEQNIIDQNPLQGIRPEEGYQGWLKYEENLGNMVTEGSTSKKGILENATITQAKKNEALIKSGEASPALLSGIKYKDLDLSNFDKIYSIATPEERLGLEALKRTFVKDEFVGKDFSAPGGGENPFYTEIPKNPTALEVDNLLKRMDHQIEDMKGWDESYLTAIKSNPSRRNLEVSALKALRGAVKEAHENHVGVLLGEETKTALQQANLNIATGLEYGKTAENFRLATGEGETPGSGRAAVTPNQGMVPTSKTAAVNKVLGPSEATLRARNLAREENAIVRLQQVIGWRKQELPIPMSRKTDVVLSSPVTKNFIGFMAYQMGIVADPREFSSAPPPVQKAMTAAIMKTNPSVFEPPQSGFPSEMDGKIKDPTEGHMYLEETYDKYANDPSKRASILGPFLENKTYVNPNPQAPQNNVNLSPIIQPPVDLRSFSGALPDVEMQQDNSGTYQDSMVDKLHLWQNNVNSDESGL